MAYHLKQKFNIRDLVEIGNISRRVLISLPQEDLSGFYASFFRAPEFTVAQCLVPETLHEDIASFEPHVLILGTEAGGQNPKLLKIVNRVKVSFPCLPLITVGLGLPHDFLKQIMSAGAAGYIDRRFSRPRDIVAMVKTMINS